MCRPIVYVNLFHVFFFFFFFEALERNFGGLKQEDFLQLTEVFFRHLEKETDGLIARLETSSLRGILDILQEALEDLPPEDLQESLERD